MSSKPVLHYLDINSLGRGEVVRLFLKDAGIDFQDIRYAYDDTWPATSAKLQAQGITITGKVPALEYNGTILTQHISILRYLARELNDYDGQTSLEKYVVDAVADIYIDWRSQWVANLMNASEDYKNKSTPKYYSILSHYYSQHDGPFLLGDRITYADFAVYQSIDNDEKTGTLPETLPSVLVAFKKAFESRPGVKAYLESGRSTNTQ
ncbi:glutathione S-transferase, putative [Talaromyces stipitatus ATCC 10500]|uniref:Glutathione S-transferase, putative n=1 Tax=Talaromyces stipitatus (strain ATCC 10500 / CBS 375.48 / QM 6759 / NRRL 1006) TaxID=441959 RepID=B8M4S5_TALSN|nr:glutathione S-transferase, putative [Talaromyces stipitatus ATCC 10500]EED19360.1 glutathione S-transferase, putative [Talaromyces stipitatus ATCC 10500]